MELVNSAPRQPEITAWTDGPLLAGSALARDFQFLRGAIVSILSASNQLRTDMLMHSSHEQIAVTVVIYHRRFSFEAAEGQTDGAAATENGNDAGHAISNVRGARRRVLSQGHGAECFCFVFMSCFACFFVVLYPPLSVIKTFVRNS